MRLLPIAVRNVKRSGRRSILSGFAISLSTLLCIFMVCFIMGAAGDYDAMLLNYSTGMVQVRDGRFFEYDYLNPVHFYVEDEESVRREAMNTEGALQAVSRIHIPGKLYFGGMDRSGYGLAVDFDNEVMDFDEMLKEGRYPAAGEKEMVIGAKLAEKTGLQIGDRVTVLTTTAGRSSNAVTFGITGIIAFPNTVMTEWFLVPLTWGQRLAGMPGGASEVLLYLEEMRMAGRASLELRSRLPFPLEAKAYSDLNLMFDYMKIGKFVYFMLAGFFVLLGCTVIINTMMMLVYERVREIGILRSIGFRRSEISRLFFLEALFISSISALIGIVLGAWLVHWTGEVGIRIGEMAIMDSVDLDYPTVFNPRLSVRALFIAGFMAMGITSAVAWIPARRAAQMEPVDALSR
ncbi:MAG: FtsX-like permease family protein [Spirochaetales bacterium]|nr:FtsX-like permease family protein [Spirochaetales bacterium]